ncbi:15669_t:CDS:2, partial [Funneliformis mosseae]
NIKLTFEDTKQIALSKHRECLLTKYKNIAVPNSIQQGSWYPYYAGDMKLTLENASKLHYLDMAILFN